MAKIETRAEQEGACALTIRCPRELSRAIDLAASRQLLSKADYIRLATLKSLQADGFELVRAT